MQFGRGEIAFSSEKKEGATFSREERTHLRVQECQAFVEVFDLVDPHASVVWLAEFLARNYFQQFQ